MYKGKFTPKENLPKMGSVTSLAGLNEQEGQTQNFLHPRTVTLLLQSWVALYVHKLYPTLHNWTGQSGLAVSLTHL